MPDKFKGKYRIESTRLQNWDYGWNAYYFVTICTKNRECFFGDVVMGKDELPCVLLSSIGEIAQRCWMEIPKHFPFVILGNHIVMPNHVHGIVVINKPNDEHNDERVNNRDHERGVETQNFASLQTPMPIKSHKNQFGPQSQNLASIIRGFKIGVTKNARMINPGFAWQSRFHDHIIRDAISFQRISDYIINNPLNWSDDTFNKT